MLLTTIEHNMNQESLARLRRLGVMKGVRQLRSAPRQASPVDDQGLASERASRFHPALEEHGGPQPLTTLLPGLELVETAEGACYVLDRVYSLHQRHGAHRLNELLEHSTLCAARFCQDERLASTTFRDYLFLDTETTGLSGAGMLAFMVGVGFFEGEAFVVRQYFLRDHGDEPAMLLLLDELIQRFAGLITFNGRSFDLPLLDGRFVMNRMQTDLLARPHIDLLHPARRLWRLRFESCALSALEQNLLGLQRTDEDVPGWLIPSLYHQFLQSGDGRGMARVFYHNRIDMLSMVTLAARITHLFAEPQAGDHPLELLGLGKWQADLGFIVEAEQALRMAAAPELDTVFYHEALMRLGSLLKRGERREEALTVWQQVAYTSFEDVTAHVELAKYYEWHARDLAQARAWTEQALELLEGAQTSARTVHAELEHRLARLVRKMDERDDQTAR